MKESIYAAKQNRVLQRRAPTVLRLSWFVPRDQQLAGPAGSKQLNSYKNRSNNHGMNAVDSDSVDRMEVRQRPSDQPAECDVSADLSHRAARFDTSHDIASRQVLVLKTDMGLRENPYLVQLAEHVPRQDQSTMCEEVLCVNHSGILSPSAEPV